VACGIVFGALQASWAQFDGPAPLAWRWFQSTSVPPGGSPIVDGGTIYVAVGSRLYALDKETGNQKWRYPVGEPLAASFRSGAVLAENLLVAAADNKTVYAVDAATGSQKWTFTTPEAILGAPIAVGPFLVVGLTDNSFMAITLADGKPIYANPERIFNGILGSMSAYGGNVLVMDRSFNLYSIDVSSRKVNWKTVFTIASPDGKPVVFGDMIYLNTGSYVSALRAGTGQTVWQRNVGELTAFAPAVSSNGIMVVTRSGKAHTMDLSGRPISRAAIDLQAIPVTDPAPVGKLFAVPTSNGSLNLVDPSTGQLMWNFIVSPITQILSTSTTSGGDSGGMGVGGGRGGGGNTTTPARPQNYVTAASPPKLDGQTLLLLCRDGSLLAFDKTWGVDLTAPVVRMFFPLPGDVISGQPPLEFAFKIEDEASGINPSSVKVEIEGTPVDFTYSRDGILSVDISTAPRNSKGQPNKNLPLQDGRKTIVVSVADWVGNEAKASYVVTIDNALRPVGRSGQTGKSNTSGGGNVGGGKGGGL